MRKLAYSMLAMAVALLFTLPANALEMAKFEILNPYIIVGESFKVNVSVSDDGSLGDLVGFGFHVYPDSSLSFISPDSSLSLISFEGYDPGPDYEKGSGLGSFVDGLKFRVDAPAMGNTEILLATLSFTALGVGTDSLVIKGIVDDSFEGLYYLSYDGSTNRDESIEGSLDINISAAPVPEPTTILLVGARLVGLAGLRRKIPKS